MVTRRNRETGTLVTVVSEKEAGLDPDLKWWTICEDHGCLVGHYNKADAIAWASHPKGWCGVCSGNEPADEDNI